MSLVDFTVSVQLSQFTPDGAGNAGNAGDKDEDDPDDQVRNKLSIEDES